MTSVTIASSVTFIGWGAFSENQLTEVTFLGRYISFDYVPSTLKTTKGYKGSKAENFAKENGILFFRI